MGEKAEYKSAIRSRRLIRQAFVELVQEKPIEKITVTDIVTRADINRGTFYAHYADTRAVVEQIENEIIAKMLEFLGEFRYKNFFQNPLPLLLKISRYLQDDLEFYRILINAHGSEQFLTKLKKHLCPSHGNQQRRTRAAQAGPGFSDPRAFLRRWTGEPVSGLVPRGFACVAG